MNKQLLCAFIAVFIFILVCIVVMINFNNNLYMGLQPKAIYKEYKIYDVIEQKGLPCAEAIEMLDSDKTYTYYFNCLKSDKIYFVSDKETIKVREAYKRGIITKEQLYELGIVDRMVRLNNE